MRSHVFESCEPRNGVIQFCSATQSCPTLCDPMDCSTSGFPVYHQLLELTPTHVHWVSDAIQPSHPVVSFSSRLQSFPSSGSFQISQFFPSGGQSIGVSASTSVLPMNIQDWSPLEWTGWISLQSRGLSRCTLDDPRNLLKLQFISLLFVNWHWHNKLTFAYVRKWSTW